MMSVVSWSAPQYSTFEDERTRPVRDLLARIPLDSPQAAVDLGCGPGNSTEAVAARFPQAQILGVDSSPEMIAAARRRLPGIAFEEADIARWAPAAPVELLFSNAALQWVPDHAALYPALLQHLAPGGVLAVQTPDNLDEPAHRLMRQVAVEGPWASKLGAALVAREPRRSPEWYYGLLRGACSQLDIWRTTYHHHLAGGAHAVVEWFKGSGLRPYLDALSADEARDFLLRYEQAVASAYPALPDGGVLLPFPRLFIVATL